MAPKVPIKVDKRAADDGDDDGVAHRNLDFLILEERNIEVEGEAIPIAKGRAVREGIDDEKQDREVHEDQEDPDIALGEDLLGQKMALARLRGFLELLRSRLLGDDHFGVTTL
jgi:hypothetical protein